MWITNHWTKNSMAMYYCTLVNLILIIYFIVFRIKTISGRRRCNFHGSGIVCAWVSNCGHRSFLCKRWYRYKNVCRWAAHKFLPRNLWTTLNQICLKKRFQMAVYDIAFSSVMAFSQNVSHFKQLFSLFLLKWLFNSIKTTYNLFHFFICSFLTLFFFLLYLILLSYIKSISFLFGWGSIWVCILYLLVERLPFRLRRHPKFI